MDFERVIEGAVVYFTVDRDRGGQPSWWLYGSDGQLVAWAGVGFATLGNARRAAEAFSSGAESDRYEIYRDAGGSWRWHAWRSSDRVASSGASYSSEANARRAADEVRDNAGSATGP